MDIYSDQRNRKTIPKSWCGIWVDKNGRQILIESTYRNFYSLTILDNKGNSFKIELLGGKVRRTTELRGSFTKDLYDNPIL